MAKEILMDWLVKEGYHVEEPSADHVELWCKERLVARFTPSVSQGGLNQVAIDDFIAHRDWTLLRSEP